MKKVVLSFTLGILVLFSCVETEQEVLIDVQGYESLTISNIRTHLKVAHLDVDQAEFDNMYADFTREIEIDGFFSLYQSNTPLILNEQVEVEIKGNFSAQFSLKSLGVKFDDTFDNSEGTLINPENLPFHSLNKIKAFRFRNSGNDFGATMIKDISLTELARKAGLNLDLMYTEQVVVFINGKFYGLMNMRTESNANGMSRFYGVKKSNVTLAKILYGGVVEKKNGNFDRIDELFYAIEKEDLDYLKVAIDLENFIEYMIYETYIGHSDWPSNNVRLYSIDDRPFRFVLFDLDQAALVNVSEPPMTFIQKPGVSPIRDLFNILYEDKSFKEHYDNRYEELVRSGLLSSDCFETIVNDFMENIEHIMPTQIEKYNQPDGMGTWYFQVERLKNYFEWRSKFVESLFGL